MKDKALRKAFKILAEELEKLKENLLAKDAADEQDGQEVSEKDLKDQYEKRICPATHQEVKVYREVCLDWESIPDCYGGVCGMYPALNRVPVREMTASKKVVAKVGGTEIVEGGRYYVVAHKTEGVLKKLSKFEDGSMLFKVITPCGKIDYVSDIKVKAVMRMCKWYDFEGRCKRGCGQINVLKKDRCPVSVYRFEECPCYEPL